MFTTLDSAEAVPVPFTKDAKTCMDIGQIITVTFDPTGKTLTEKFTFKCVEDKSKVNVICLSSPITAPTIAENFEMFFFNFFQSLFL